MSLPAAEIIEFGERLYKAGWAPASDGNISLRTSENRILITRSGACKGELTESDLIESDLNGKPFGTGRVSSEVHLHLQVYRLRPDIKVVIHAHPPMVITCSLAGINLEEPLLPEMVMTLGSIPTAEFAAPSSPEGAEVIKNLVLNNNAIILDRHGSITLGRTLSEAFQRLERLEFAAGIVYRAKLTGNVKYLNEVEIKRLQTSAEQYRINLES